MTPLARAKKREAEASLFHGPSKDGLLGVLLHQCVGVFQHFLAIEATLAHVRHPFVIQRVRGFLPVLQLRLGNHGDGVTASDQLFLADRIGTSLCLTQEG